MPNDYGFEKWDIEPLLSFSRGSSCSPLKGYSEQIEMLKKPLARNDAAKVINACEAAHS